MNKYYLLTYKDTIDWLFQQLPMYQRQGSSAHKANLDNTHRLDNHLDHPHQNFKSIHVGGTNGKGSVSHMLASIFQEAGYKVGLYTSPHLKDFRERIKINGEMIAEQDVVNFINQNKSFFLKHQLSFFEMTVGLAFNYFSSQKVDIAIIEVGLGGRLDSTNIITPIASVITNIGLDHTKFLGNSLTAIATEKAGIIKPNIPTIIGESTAETKPVFQRTALNKQSSIYFAEESAFSKHTSDLKGNYQKLNIRTVLKTIEVLKNDWSISECDIRLGLKHVIKNTGLMGRWQVLKTHPLIVCDTAHNKEGLLIVMEQLLKMKYSRLHIVLGVVNDKDLQTILPLFPQTATYYFCKPNVPRGMSVDLLCKEASLRGMKGKSYKSVDSAFKAAQNSAANNDVIFVGGSTFTVAEVL